MNAEELIAYLADLQVAIDQEQTAKSKYQGHSWGYAGFMYVEARKQAAESFNKKLDEYIDYRIALALEKSK